MKPVCVKCQRFYRMKKSGFYFIEAMPIENKALPGTQEPEKWTPYKVWAGDKWQCEGCGHELLSGFGREAIVEHYQSDFQQVVENLHADQLQVNDC